MTLIAKKPCSFGGKKFYIGDPIPAEYVINPKEQEKMGVIAIVDGDVPVAPAGNAVPVPVRVPITMTTDEGDMPLEVTAGGLQAVFAVLTAKADDAEPIIENMTDGDALILLHICDSRKTIKAAAEARAQAINVVEEAPEEVDEPEASETEEAPEEVDEPEASEVEEAPEESAGEQ